MNTAAGIPVFQYDGRKLDKDAKLFDAGILSDNWVLFHGTSSTHESSIDREGLHSRRYQVSKGEMMAVLNIYRSMNWRWSTSLISLTSWSFPEFEDADGDFRALFLTGDPTVAASYAGRRNAGGESTQMLLNCVRELRGYLRQPAKRMEHFQHQWEEFEANRKKGRSSPILTIRSAWLRERLRELTPLYKRLTALQREHHHGVIYAIRFGPEDLSRFSNSNGSTFVVRGQVEPEKIIAKAVIRGRVKDLRQTGRFSPLVSLDEATLPGAVAKLLHAAARNKRPTIGHDRWDDTVCDPSAGRDLLASVSVEDLRDYLSGKYAGFFAPFE